MTHMVQNCNLLRRFSGMLRVLTEQVTRGAHRMRRIFKPAGRLDGARPAARAPHAPGPPQRPRRQRQAPVAEAHAALQR